MRVCGKCKGSGWYGPRTDLGRPLGNRQRGGPCRACKGTGGDNRWSEKSCRKCYGTIEYRTDWSNVPDYCENCRKDQHKSCTNPHCSGTIRYKVFWDNIPDYCGCKGWFKKPCGNPHCHGQIDANCRQPDKYKYCKACKGWYEKPCATTDCCEVVSLHCEMHQPPDRCEKCRKMFKRQGAELCYGNELEQYLGCSRGVRVRQSRNDEAGPDYWHVTVWVDGGHVSANVHKYLSKSTNFHRTLEVYDKDGKRRDKETW